MPQEIWTPSPVIFSEYGFFTKEAFFFRKLKLNGLRPMYTNTFDTILQVQSVFLLGEQRYVENDHENSCRFLFVNKRCFFSSQARVLRYPNSGQYSPISVQ